MVAAYIQHCRRRQGRRPLHQHHGRRSDRNATITIPRDAGVGYLDVLAGAPRKRSANAPVRGIRVWQANPSGARDTDKRNVNPPSPKSRSREGTPYHARSEGMQRDGNPPSAREVRGKRWPPRVIACGCGARILPARVGEWMGYRSDIRTPDRAPAWRGTIWYTLLVLRGVKLRSPRH